LDKKVIDIIDAPS